MKLDRLTRWMLAMPAVLAMNACGGEPESSADETPHAGAGAAPAACAVRAVAVCPAGVTYATVEPILQSKCLSCHDDIEDGTWPLTSYEEVSAWQHKVRTEILSCSMPPPDSELALTTEEGARLLGWLRCGAPP